MYSSGLYGPPSGRTYIGRDSNGYRAYSHDIMQSTGSPTGARRYNNDHHFPPSRHRPPLPTYTMQSVSRSSSYAANSANHNKNITAAPDAFANSRYDLSLSLTNHTKLKIKFCFPKVKFCFVKIKSRSVDCKGAT